jgi:TolB-like protein
MTTGLLVAISAAVLAVLPTLNHDPDPAGGAPSGREPAVRQINIDAAALAQAQGQFASRARIAVLPIATAKSDPASALAALGCTLGLTGDLRYVPGLLVLDRSEVRAATQASLAPGAIGRKLGVRYVLAGVLRRDGPAEQLDADVIEIGPRDGAEDQGRVQAHSSAQRPLGQIDELAGAVLLDLLGQLKIAVPPEALAEMARVPTPSDSARILCDDGLSILDRTGGLNRGDDAVLIRRALLDSHAALKSDPRYLRALLLQASCLLRLGETEALQECLTQAHDLRTPEERIDLLTRLEIDADHAALVQRDPAAAVALYQRILDIDPGHLPALWMLTALHAGEYPPSDWPGYNLEKAGEFAARLITAHPGSPAARLLKKSKP